MKFYQSRPCFCRGGIFYFMLWAFGDGLKYFMESVVASHTSAVGALGGNEDFRRCISRRNFVIFKVILLVEEC